MRTAAISIIIPVYNVESYLDQCIASVLTQSFRDLELILVNDGSTDTSLEKCRAWEKDPRVTILSMENRGVSAARNLGLQKASGKWILFLDSDDYLLDNCLESLMGMVSPDTQEVIAAYADRELEISDSLHQSVTADSVTGMILDAVNHQLLPSFYEIKPLSLPACWGKLFRNDIIHAHGIRFYEELRLSEDTLFHLDYLSCIDTVTVTDLPVIHYRQNTASVTNVFSPNHLGNRLRFFEILKERNGPDAAVHILSLLLLEICKIERYAKGQERKLLEKDVAAYLSANTDILCRVRKLSLSSGRWQKLIYQAAAVCFRKKAYWAGFALLRSYAALT